MTNLSENDKNTLSKFFIATICVLCCNFLCLLINCSNCYMLHYETMTRLILLAFLGELLEMNSFDALMLGSPATNQSTSTVKPVKLETEKLVTSPMNLSNAKQPVSTANPVKLNTKKLDTLPMSLSNETSPKSVTKVKKIEKVKLPKNKTRNSGDVFFRAKLGDENDSKSTTTTTTTTGKSTEKSSTATGKSTEKSSTTTGNSSEKNSSSSTHHATHRKSKHTFPLFSLCS